MAPAGACFYGVYDLLKAAHFKRAAEQHAAAGGAAAAAGATAAAGELHQELPAAYTLLVLQACWTQHGTSTLAQLGVSSFR